MQFDITDSGALKVLLSDSELGRMGLTFSDLDGSSSVTQTALKTVLLSAEAQAGFDISDPMYIEAIPVEGGCLLLFTPDRYEKRRFSRRAAMTTAVWRFDEADALVSFGRAIAPFAAWIRRQASLCAASLYRQGEQYLLVLYAPSLLPRGILPILAEFAQRAGGEKAAARIAEHGIAVSLQDALIRLTAAGSSSPVQTDAPH